MQYFEWDEAKAASNERKHRVSFRDATRVFHDDLALSEPDDLVDGELRGRIIGKAGPVQVLFVVYTVVEDGLDEVIRIISARKAKKSERSRYEQDRSHEHG